MRRSTLLKKDGAKHMNSLSFKLQGSGFDKTFPKSFEPGQIVVAPIPFSNMLSSKIRPALIISRRSYNEKSGDVIVLKVTSKTKGYPFDVSLWPKDLKTGTLKEESAIQADFPVVIEKKSISGCIGEIEGRKMHEVKQKIRELYLL